jgi:predicted phosphodiesterase
MPLLIRLLVLFVFSGSASAQSVLKMGDIPGDQKPYTHLNINNDPDKFHFVVVTDNTGASRPGIWPKGVSKINLMQPEFVVSVGDLIQGYTRDLVTLNKQWEVFNSWTSKFTMPFFYVPGNHDYTNEVMVDLWKKKYGADYYHFVYQNVLFLCLNSEDGATALKNPDFSEAQFDYVKKILAENESVRHTFVLMHQPLWLHENAKNWKRVEQLLTQRKHSVFTGHLHQYALHARNNSDYFVLATMGGGSQLRGKKYGEFDHFLWVTMKDDGPVYANVFLDGVEEKDIQTYEMLTLKNEWRANPPYALGYLFFEGTKPNQWPVQFTAKNTTPDTLQVSLTFNGLGLLGKALLLPGESHTQTISLPAENVSPANPLVGNLTLESSSYAWDHPVKWAPQEKLFVPKRKSVKIDGDLEEWKNNVIYEKEDEKGNGKFVFGVREDDENVYVAVKVEDREILSGFGNSSSNQDGIYISLDARTLDLSSQNRQNQGDLLKNEWLFISAPPVSESFHLEYLENLPSGVTGKGKQTKDGYQVEVAIPHSWLNERQGKSWEHFRLNVSVLNKNKNLINAVRYSWQQNWSDGVPGSGTFFRR